jgi:hypothetical protein
MKGAVGTYYGKVNKKDILTTVVTFVKKAK